MDPLTSYIAGQRGALEVQRQREAIPLQRQQGQLAVQQMEQQIDAGARQKTLQGAQVMDLFLRRVKEIPDPQQRLNLFQRAIPELKKFGIDLPPAEKITLESVSDTGLIPLETGIGRALQQNTAELQGIEGKAKALVGAMNPETKKPFTLEEAKQAIVLRGEGIVPRAGMSAQERIAQDEALTQQVAQSKSQIKAAEETGKLSARIELEPALVKAKAEVEALVEKRIGQQGQLGKLADATALYNNLSNANLDKIYGRGESVYPEMLRSQEGIDLLAQRNQLVSMLKLGAAGELKGQGSVTDSERKMLAESATLLENPNISPTLAKAALDDAMRVLSRGAGQEFNAPQASGQGAQQQQRTGGQIMQDANGNRAMVYPDGSFEEIR